MEKIKLGQVVRDSITSYEGVAVARTEWLNGCTRVTIQSRVLKDGSPIETYTVDEPQCIVVEDTPEGAVDAAGGPRPEPSRHANPGR